MLVGAAQGIDVVVCPLEEWVDPACAIAAVTREPLPAVLDSADAHVAGPRHILLASRPARVIEATHPRDADPFNQLAELLGALRVPRLTDMPYGPGWIGYFGYEAGRWLEVLPATTDRVMSLPDARWALYDTVAVGDVTGKQWTVISVDLPADFTGPRPSAQERARRLADTLRNAARLARGGRDSRFHLPNAANSTVSPAITPERFLTLVDRARRYIAAGDIFQVNLCHHLRAPMTIHPREVYLRLRAVNPADYGAYISFGDKAILSASPELYLRLRGRRVVTRPIKGTRPRTGNPEIDDMNRRALVTSEKDHAELAMIIDLERNDLGRVCEYGSVRVERPWELETHPSVFHLVSTVAGTLRPSCDQIDLLRATFPGGSITGAPKIRAMQIIDELEDHTRGVYCGAIGHLGLDGDMTLNIAIRTIIADGSLLHFPVGSGIVADSVPEDEYAETLAKGAGLLAAVTGNDAPVLADGRSPLPREVCS